MAEEGIREWVHALEEPVDRGEESSFAGAEC